MRLKNKVAIVTGGSAGIGKGLALGLAKEGAKVVITARHEERLKRAAKEIKSIGGEVLPLRSDVSVMKDINQMVKNTLDHFGKIDTLVNNAGIIPTTPFFEVKEETFGKIVHINLKGLYFCTQAVVKSMAERRYGKIINISSTIARVPYPWDYSIYAGTKGAIVTLTRSLAVELAPLGIFVNCIACGGTKTEGLETMGIPEEMREAAISAVPLKRWGMPEDYVGIAVFLASDESSFMTGQSISVDGGVSMP